MRWLLMILLILPTSAWASQTGSASYYGPRFAGRPTSSGEIFRPWKMTAAHRTLPMHTIIRVRNLRTHRAVIVRVNDRGPYVGHRIIDVSQGAASKLRMVKAGVDRVTITVLHRPRHAG